MKHIAWVTCIMFLGMAVVHGVRGDVESCILFVTVASVQAYVGWHEKY